MRYRLLNRDSGTLDRRKRFERPASAAGSRRSELDRLSAELLWLKLERDRLMRRIASLGREAPPHALAGRSGAQGVHGLDMVRGGNSRKRG